MEHSCSPKFNLLINHSINPYFTNSSYNLDFAYGFIPFTKWKPFSFSDIFQMSIITKLLDAFSNIPSVPQFSQFFSRKYFEFSFKIIIIKAHALVSPKCLWYINHLGYPYISTSTKFLHPQRTLPPQLQCWFPKSII